MLRRLAWLLALSSPLPAQDGSQLYATYCSACHGQDGKGASEGAFPPLADSPWLAGDPERAIQIVLHGLQGPIHVNGKPYHLEMPPQGSVLSDEQIASILSYVRSSWNHEPAPLSAGRIAGVRQATRRKEPWTAEELLALYPLEREPSALQNLRVRLYLGQWNDLPDFSQLPSHADAAVPASRLGLTHGDPPQDHFGLVWEGEFIAAREGKYQFRLDADDGARVMLRGALISEVRHTGPMDGSRRSTGSVDLTQGAHPIRIEYFEDRGRQDLSLGWKGPGEEDGGWHWISEQTGESALPWPSIPLSPAPHRAAIYRNFIEGTTPRAIGVGFPGGMNLAWSADHLAPELLWPGDFIDAGRHWTDRGIGPQRPGGMPVVKLSGSPALAPPATFRGYQLDPSGNPTFLLQIGEQWIRDAWQPDAGPGQPALRRTLTAEGTGGPLEYLLTELATTPLRGETPGPSEYELGPSLILQTDGSPLRSHDGKTVLTLSPGQPVTLRYRWK